MRGTKVNMVAEILFESLQTERPLLFPCVALTPFQCNVYKETDTYAYTCQSLYKRCIEMESVISVQCQIFVANVRNGELNHLRFCAVSVIFYDCCKSKVTGSFSHPEFSQVTRDD